MPRLREPMAAKKEASIKDELFDSEKIEKPEDKKPEDKELQLEAVADDKPPESKVEVEPPRVEEKPKDDASAALQRELDAIKRNEALQRELVQARQASTEYQEKALQAQKDALDAEEITLTSRMEQAQSDAERAQLEMENAISNGDAKAQSEAYRRLAKAEGSAIYFQDKVELTKNQKQEFEKEQKRLSEAKTQTQPQQDYSQLPHIVAFRQEHPEFFKGDPVKDAELRHLFLKSHAEGFAPYSAAQVDRIKEMIKPPKEERREPEKGSSFVSAPVSREVPSGGSGQRPTGKITLTRDQLDAAKIAGVSPAEYARQLIRINEMKANGEYGDRR